MIQLRKVGETHLTKRGRYQVQLVDDESGHIEWSETTTTPITLIDRYIGVAEAWALLHQADDEFNRAPMEWVRMPPSQFD